MITHWRRKPKVVQVLVVDENNITEFNVFVGNPDGWDEIERLGSVPVFPDMAPSLVEHGDLIIKHGQQDFEILLESEITTDWEQIL